MKVAFLMDASVEDYRKIEIEDNMFVVPFQVYDSNGNLRKEYHRKNISKSINHESDISIIAPTPGMYRDAYKEIMEAGYDYIIVIPANKNISKSYTYALYASRLGFNNIMVVDVSDYDLSAKDVLSYIVNEQIQKDVKKITIDIDSLIDYARSILNSLSLIKNAD